MSNEWSIELMEKWGRRKDGRRYKKTKYDKKIIGLKVEDQEDRIGRTLPKPRRESRFANTKPKFKFLNSKEYAKLTREEKDNYHIQQLDARGINTDFKGRELDSFLSNEEVKNTRFDSDTLNVKYCSGKHKCQICGKKFKCHGEESTHSDGKGSGRCHGGYLQFCGNHSVKEYEKAHKKLGELDVRINDVKQLNKMNVQQLGQQLQMTSTSKEDKKREEVILDNMLRQLKDKKLQNVNEYEYVLEQMDINDKSLLPEEKRMLKRAFHHTHNESKLKNVKSFEDIHAEHMKKQDEREREQLVKALSRARSDKKHTPVFRSVEDYLNYKDIQRMKAKSKKR